MAVTFSLVLFVIVFLYAFAFVFAIGAEMRRSTATVTVDMTDESTYCQYDTAASTVYGVSAFGLLLLGQAVVTTVTRCLYFGRGLTPGGSATCATVSFFLSWFCFLGADVCLLVGSIKNAYHTKQKGVYGGEDLGCATLPKGVFTASAVFIFLAMVSSVLYYWAHNRADTGGWEKRGTEGLELAEEQQQSSHYEKP